MCLPVCKVPTHRFSEHSKGSGDKGGSATSWSRAGLRWTAQEQDKCVWAGNMLTVEWDSAKLEAVPVLPSLSPPHRQAVT